MGKVIQFKGVEGRAVKEEVEGKEGKEIRKGGIIIIIRRRRRRRRRRRMILIVKIIS